VPNNVSEKIDWLNGQIDSRATWLRTHGTKAKPWPEGDIDSKQRGLEMMQDIRDDYQKSLDRAKAQND
jgi:hypothetical protein